MLDKMNIKDHTFTMLLSWYSKHFKEFFTCKCTKTKKHKL